MCWVSQRRRRRRRLSPLNSGKKGLEKSVGLVPGILPKFLQQFPELQTQISSFQNFLELFWKISGVGAIALGLNFTRKFKLAFEKGRNNPYEFLLLPVPLERIFSLFM